MTSFENNVIDLGDYEVDASSNLLPWGRIGRDLLGRSLVPLSRASLRRLLDSPKSRLPDHFCRLVADDSSPLACALA